MKIKVLVSGEWLASPRHFALRTSHRVVLWRVAAGEPPTAGRIFFLGFGDAAPPPHMLVVVNNHCLTALLAVIKMARLTALESRVWAVVRAVQLGQKKTDVFETSFSFSQHTACKNKGKILIGESSAYPPISAPQHE